MNSNKNFEAYAKSLFGDEYGEKKGEKAAAPWPVRAEVHPKPFDVIVVDSNDKKMTSDKKGQKERPKNTGIGNKSSKKSRRVSKDNGPLTPVVIDLNESPFAEEKPGSLFRKRRKSESKETKKSSKPKPKSEYDFDLDLGQPNKTTKEISKHHTKNKKSSFQLERGSSERDSGISLNDEGEESDAIHLDIFSENQQTESDNELAYFCVDHMKLCKSRSDFRRHRRCVLKSETDSPGTVTVRKTQEVKPRDLPKTTEREPERSSTSFSVGSRRFGGRGGRNSAAAIAGMQTMCKESLEKLYNYAGVMIEDRQSLVAELKNKKALMEETMFEYMEEIITHILKLKNRCIAGVEKSHTENLTQIAQQLIRAEKIRQETYAIWQSLQVPDDYSSFEDYKGVISKSGERSLVLKEIVRHLHDSCRTFTYELKNEKEAEVLYEVEDIASVQEIPAIPTLPPFLSVKSDADAENEETKSSFKSLERIENVGGRHESGNEKCCFTGCAYILDDSVLLADWSNGVIKLLNKLGLVADTFAFEQSPWDVIQNCTGQAAVTVPNLQTVFFVEAEPHLRIVDYFKTGSDCFGICKIGDNYAVTCDPWSRSPSVRVFDSAGNTLLRMQTDSIGVNYFKCPLHICSDYFNTVLYVSDASADCVYAVSLSGDVIFTYEHDEMEYPTGVTTDRNNCLFVCGRASSNVHKLSNDGSLQEILVKKVHGVSSPCAVAFHQNGDHMILTDLEGEMSSGYWKMKFM